MDRERPERDEMTADVEEQRPGPDVEEDIGTDAPVEEAADVDEYATESLRRVAGHVKQGAERTQQAFPDRDVGGERVEGGHSEGDRAQGERSDADPPEGEPRR